MSFFCDLLRCLRVHQILEVQQLVVKMLHGIVERPTVLAAVGERSCDADRAEGIQPVRVLEDLCFDRLRHFSLVFTEGNGIDRFNDLFDAAFRNAGVL